MVRLNIMGSFKDKGFSLAVAWAFNQLAYAIVYPFIPIYLSNERGISITTVALIFPLMGLSVVVAPPVAGYLTDKIGRGFMMDFGQVARSVLFLILALFTWLNAPFWIFAVMLMLNSAVGVAFQVGADTYLADVVPMELRPVCYSKIRIGYNLGWAIGPMLGAFFSKTPFWLFFLFTAIFCLAGAVYTHIVCKAPLWVERKSLDTTSAPTAPNQENILRLILSRKALPFLLIGSLLIVSLSSQLYSTLSIFSTQRMGITSKELGMIYSLNGFMVMVLQIPITAYLNRKHIPLTSQLLIGCLLYGFGYFAIDFTPSAAYIAAAVFVITLGEMTINPALYSAFTAETRPENAGRIMASYSLMRGIGYSIGPWLGALLFQRLTTSWGLWTTLSGFAFLAAGSFLCSHHVRQRHRQPEDSVKNQKR